MDPSTSNTVLLAMIQFLQGEVEAAQRARDEARHDLWESENIRDSQARVIRSLHRDLATAERDVTRLHNGAEVVCRAMDELYRKAQAMRMENRLSEEDWNDYYRAMLRGDVGFAILNGADFVDLTTNENMEGETTEEEDNSE